MRCVNGFYRSRYNSDLMELVWGMEVTQYNVAKLLRHDVLKRVSEAHCETGMLKGAIWYMLRL
jgi:hypothetical protein